MMGFKQSFVRHLFYRTPTMTNEETDIKTEKTHTMAGEETDKKTETRNLIKDLEAARGNRNSMITLIILPCDTISRVTRMLEGELEFASKMRKQSVVDAITSAQQRLQLYDKVPPNGLVIYTGTFVTEDGKEKKVAVDFEPFRPVNTSWYLYDDKFHTGALYGLLESE